MVIAAAEQHRVVGAGGVPLAVHLQRIVEDDPHQVPVLLVHGFGSNAAANWGVTGWWRALTRAGRTIVAVDLRGHGHSGRPHDHDAYSVGILLDDLLAVLRWLPGRLGPTPLVDLVGYSLGGRLVAELASAPVQGEVPQPRRLVIGGQDGRPLVEDVDIAELARLLAAERVSDERLASDRPVGRPVPGPVPGGVRSPAQRLAAIATADESNDLVALLAAVTGLVHDGRAAERAPNPVQPALLVAGADDPLAHDIAGWAAALPAGRSVAIPGRDHVSVITAGSFRRTAVDFLTG